MFVCFNKDLAAALRQRNPEESEAIMNVDKLFRGLVPATVRTPAAPAQVSDFFRQELPSLVLDAAATLPTELKYDAIIVDEGQDFSEEQLIALHDLLRDAASQWAFFADWRWDLFRAGKGGAVGADVVFRLHHNCRNTSSVNSATNTYLRQHIDSMPGMPAGTPPTVERCPSREAMALRAWELAKQWDSGNGVVILSPFRLEHSAMAGSPRGHGLVLTNDIERFGRPGTVHFSTIRSFKGIEATGVILVDADVPSMGSPLTEEDLYVACTRPTARLAVLTTSDQAIQWLAHDAMGSHMHAGNSGE
ncbi:hypothetical protein H1235_12670 [Pseudoxanthomonas sp. NC8]|nr:hypothetical protein H1235_12670 [Pseudoxanthomonas sp. NC8]